MAEILSLSRWSRQSYEVKPGVELHMKLKRLKRAEAKPLQKVLIAVFQKYEEADNKSLSTAQQAALMGKVYEVIPEDALKAWFGECVKDVEAFELDGVPVSTGPALLEEADDRLLFWILMRLNELSKLTTAEGNASASRSTSQLTAGGNGTSPVPSTAREAGTSPSTAGAITIEAVPSIAPA